jgi:hypothetical protein
MNMSYCRFQNTKLDLQDCIDAVDVMLNNNEVDEHEDHLSRQEKNAMIEMIEMARYFNELAEELAEKMEWNN